MALNYRHLPFVGIYRMSTPVIQCLMIIFCLFLKTFSFAQEADSNSKSGTLNNEKWEELNPSYDYESKVESEKLRKKKEAYSNNNPTAKRIEQQYEEVSESDNGTPFYIPGLGLILKMIAIMVVVGALAFLLYKLLDSRYNFSSKKIKPNAIDPSFEEIEENIHEFDLQGLLDKALSENNLRVAIRIYYLMIIKSLSENNLIQWRKNKTNGEYLYEMSQRPEYESFQIITSKFERIWFGEEAGTTRNYQKEIDLFRSFFVSLSGSGEK